MNKIIPSCLLGVALLTFVAAPDATVVNAIIVPLGELLRVTENQTGVSFVVPRCLRKDTVSKDIPAILSAKTLAELLEGYNYGAVWDGRGNLVRVVVTGRIGSPDVVCPEDAAENPAQTVQQMSSVPEQLLLYDPMPVEIPERYRQMPPGSVNPVSLPIAELHRMDLGERLDMSLPDGQFGVILENRFEHDNGDVTWVGYLEGTDSSDRVIITGGSEGSVGQVITPESTYSIEFDMGQSWLVDTGRRESQGAMNPFAPDPSFLP